MSRLRLSPLRLAALLGAALPAILAPAAAHAQSETRTSADIGLNAGWQANPFSSVDDSTGAGYVGLDIVPRIQLLTERSTLSVSGALRGQQYFSRYGRNDTYAGTVDYVTRPSERVTAHGRLDVSSSVLGAFGNYFPGATDPAVPSGTVPGTLPGTLPGAPGTVTPGVPGGFPNTGDIGLFGLRDRRQSVSAAGDISAPLSARDSINASVFGESARFNRFPQLSNYDAYGSTIGYSRQVTGNLSAGLQGSVSKFDYRNDFGDATSYSIQATASGRLNELWTLNGALGVTFVKSGSINATRETSLSGNVNMCRAGQRTTACVQAARQVRPTGIVGTQYVTNVGGTWQYRLNERENVSLGVSYSNIGQDARLRVVEDQLQNIQNEFVQTSVNYDRQIRQRLRMTATANYRRVFGGSAGSVEDYGGQVGLSYRLGDLR